MLTRLYKHTTEKAIQIIHDDTKRCSFSLIIGKKPIKNHRKNCFSLLSSVKKKQNFTIIHCWRNYGKIGKYILSGGLNVCNTDRRQFSSG